MCINGLWFVYWNYFPTLFADNTTLFVYTSDIDLLPLQNPLNNELIFKCLSADKLSLDVKEMHQMILTKIDSY